MRSRAAEVTDASRTRDDIGTEHRSEGGARRQGGRTAANRSVRNPGTAADWGRGAALAAALLAAATLTPGAADAQTWSLTVSASATDANGYPQISEAGGTITVTATRPTGGSLAASDLALYYNNTRVGGYARPGKYLQGPSGVGSTSPPGT